MKYFTLLLLILSMGINLQSVAQENKNHEIGIRMSHLNDFSFLFKKQRKDNVYTVLHFASADVRFIDDFSDRLSLAGSISASIGNEKRKSINDNLSFIRGLGFFTTLASLHNKNLEVYNKSNSISLGAFYKLGLNMVVKENWNISLETAPRINATLDADSNGSSRGGLNLDMNSSAVSLGLCYTFTKKKTRQN